MAHYTMYYLPILAGFSFYLLLVQALRYRRRDAIQRRLSYKTREEMASMSLSVASTVMRELSLQEFPIIFYGSLSFALFKVLGPMIPARYPGSDDAPDRPTAYRPSLSCSSQLASFPERPQHPSAGRIRGF